MTLVFISKVYDPVEWSQALRAHMPDLDMRVWPEVGDPREVECVLVWKAPPGDLQRYPNLKLIQFWITHPQPQGQDEFSTTNNSVLFNSSTGACNTTP